MRQALGSDKLKAVYSRVARRYDVQHWLSTAGSDQRGRRLLVGNTVGEGDRVLDCGAGTGSTALLASRAVGPAGRVVLFDVNEAMLAVAMARAAKARVGDRLEFSAGDMVHLPFADDCFDVVLSTYSMCPLYDPAKGALELYRVTRRGGRIGVAHSTHPRACAVKWLADHVENLVWRIPSVSLGCRAVSVLPALEQAGGRLVSLRRIGVPLWPFLVFVLEKP
jgi:ubiquinone/menaquinone biosynthesis C-methylase UbiE